MNKPINLAIIGLGYWGPNFARLCYETENIFLKYCCDIDDTALNKIRIRYPGVTIVNDYHQILADKEVDGVIVVNNKERNFSLCKDILESGKDVLVEKPLTLKSKDAEKLIATAKKHSRILVVDHIFQYNSGIEKLRSIVKDKTLGRVFYLSGAYTALGPVRNDVNAILDLAPHHFYILNYVLDKKPLWISATGENYLKAENSDVSFITIGYDDNILAKVDVSWLFPFKVRNLVIVGEKKMAFFDDSSPDEKLKIYDKSAFFDSSHPEYPAILKIVYREGDIIVPHLAPKEPLKEVLMEFRDRIVDRKKPKSDGADGLVVVKMLEGAQASLHAEGKRISLYEQK